MDNKDKHYLEFLQMFKNKPDKQEVYLGIVKKLEPLVIEAGGLELYKHNLMATDYYIRQINSGNTITSSVGVSHNLNEGIKIGDTLLLLKYSEINNKNVDPFFIIISKLRRL